MEPLVFVPRQPGKGNVVVSVLLPDGMGSCITLDAYASGAMRRSEGPLAAETKVLDQSGMKRDDAADLPDSVKSAIQAWRDGRVARESKA